MIARAAIAVGTLLPVLLVLVLAVNKEREYAAAPRAWLQRPESIHSDGDGGACWIPENETYAPDGYAVSVGADGIVRARGFGAEERVNPGERRLKPCDGRWTSIRLFPALCDVAAPPEAVYAEVLMLDAGPALVGYADRDRRPVGPRARVW